MEKITSKQQAQHIIADILNEYSEEQLIRLAETLSDRSQYAHQPNQLDPAENLKAVRWYTLGQPWCHSEIAGMTIFAGSDDPHAATFVAETECQFDLNDFGRDTARSIAQHIVDLHNASLENLTGDAHD